MSSRWQQNTGLLILRTGLGGVLVAHGVQKLFGWLGGGGLEGTAAAFEQMGFVPGRQSALAAGLGEAGGGLLIALGVATPAAGAAAAGAAGYLTGSRCRPAWYAHRPPVDTGARA